MCARGLCVLVAGVCAWRVYVRGQCVRVTGMCAWSMCVRDLYIRVPGVSHSRCVLIVSVCVAGVCVWPVYIRDRCVCVAGVCAWPECVLGRVHAHDRVCYTRMYAPDMYRSSQVASVPPPGEPATSRSSATQARVLTIRRAAMLRAACVLLHCPCAA